MSLLQLRTGGIQAENFSVAVYYEKDLLLNLIAVQPVNDLGAGEVTALKFSWNTTDIPPGNYTISARASMVPGETHITNNICADGVVEVKIVGDISGDNSVNWKDLLMLARAYGSQIGDPKFVSAVDFNDDGKIDWEDLLILAQNYGKEWEQS